MAKLKPLGQVSINHTNIKGPPMIEIIPNKLWIDSPLYLAHSCSQLKDKPIPGFAWRLKEIKDILVCPYCKEDYSSYLPFITLYVNLNP